MSQPILPAETPLSDIEAYILDLQPRNLWPPNQNSNFGLIRYLLANDLEIGTDLLTELAAETFIPTASGYLSRWEKELDLPPGQGGRTDIQRRSALLARRPKGPFTWKRRADLIEMFLAETFGTAVSFSPDGIPLDSGGIALFADLDFTSLHSVYRIYEDVRNFSYTVQIVNTVVPDIIALTRELARITPAGISFTIDNSLAEINDYGKAMMNTQPVWWSRFHTNANDFSGYANNGILYGSPAQVAAPGLLASTSSSDGCYDFDGVDDYIEIPAAPQITNCQTFSMVALMQLDTLPSPGSYRTIAGASSSENFLAVESNGALLGKLYVDGVLKQVVSPPGAISLAQTYLVFFTYDGKVMRLYRNDVQMGQTSASGSITMGGVWLVGAQYSTAHRFDGRLDEIALCNRALTQTEITELYNQAIGNVI